MIHSMSMFPTALCGCFLAASPFHPVPDVLIRDGDALHALRGVPAPVGARELFARIASTVDVSGLPLAWLETAGGRGGFFRGDLVAVGEADVRAMTGALVARSRGHADAREVYGAIVRVLLAHEIGHAVQAKLGMRRNGPDAEQEADLTAGWIAESLGWPELGDAMVLDMAGHDALEGMASHPSSARRVGAYRAGRLLRRARGAVGRA